MTTKTTFEQRTSYKISPWITCLLQNLAYFVSFLELVWIFFAAIFLVCALFSFFLGRDWCWWFHNPLLPTQGFVVRVHPWEEGASLTSFLEVWLPPPPPHSPGLLDVLLLPCKVICTKLRGILLFVLFLHSSKKWTTCKSKENSKIHI